MSFNDLSFDTKNFLMEWVALSLHAEEKYVEIFKVIAVNKEWRMLALTAIGNDRSEVFTVHCAPRVDGGVAAAGYESILWGRMTQIVTRAYVGRLHLFTVAIHPYTTDGPLALTLTHRITNAIDHLKARPFQVVEDQSRNVSALIRLNPAYKSYIKYIWELVQKAQSLLEPLETVKRILSAEDEIRSDTVCYELMVEQEDMEIETTIDLLQEIRAASKAIQPDITALMCGSGYLHWDLGAATTSSVRVAKKRKRYK